MGSAQAVSWLAKESGLSSYSTQGYLNEIASARKKEVALGQDEDDFSETQTCDYENYAHIQDMIQPVNLLPLLELYHPWAVLICSLVFSLELFIDRLVRW